MKKILTIIVPTFNMKKYLDKCLTSLIVSDDKQHLLEVLVINDGSSDNSSQIAHGFSERYPHIFRVIDKDNGNYGSCINYGLSETNSKYVKILDADDFFDLKGLCFFLDFLSRCDSDCIFTDFQKITENGKKLPTPKIDMKSSVVHKVVPDKMSFRMWQHQVTYKVSVLKNIGYRQSVGISYTDQEWIFLPMAACASFEYCPTILYYYLVGRVGQTIDNSVWEKNFWMELKGMYVMLNERQKLFHGCTETGEKYLDCRLRKRAFAIYNAQYLKFETEKNIVALKELDDYLSQYHPSIIHYLDSQRFLYVVPFHYIKRYRRKFEKNKLVLLSYKIVNYLISKMPIKY